MEFNRPILWKHGLFLQPQHFQMNDLFQKSRFAPLWEFAIPWFWGVAGIEIQEASLATMSFEISSGSFLFPDGSFAVYPGNSVLEPRSFEDAWDNRDKPLSVYLGMRKISQVEPNVTMMQELKGTGAVSTRFVSQSEADAVQDLYLNGESGQVQTMRYCLKLFWEHEISQLDNYDMIPVARIEQMTERVRIVPGYIPPVLSITVSERLSSMLRDVRDRLSARGRQLESYKKLNSLSSGETDTRYLPYILALSCLNRYIPVLNSICESGQFHPAKAYAMLRQLIGEMSSFSSSMDVNGETADAEKLPAYTHTNIWECFSRATALVELALADFMAGPEFHGLMERDGDTFFIEKLDRELFNPRNQFFLVFWTKIELAQLLDYVSRLAKVTSRQFLPTIVKRALAGVELSFMAQPPREAPGRSSGFFFRLDENGKLWKQVMDDQSIAMHWDGAPEGVKLELMVVRR